MSRKRASSTAAAYTDLELMKMRAALAGQRVVECGRCGNPIEVMKHTRTWGVHVQFICKRCDLRGDAANVRRPTAR